MKTVERPNTEPMPLSGDKDPSGVPVEIAQMREAKRAARQAQRAEELKVLEEAAGKKGVITPDKRNMR